MSVLCIIIWGELRSYCVRHVNNTREGETWGLKFGILELVLAVPEYDSFPFYISSTAYHG